MSSTHPLPIVIPVRRDEIDHRTSHEITIIVEKELFRAGECLVLHYLTDNPMPRTCAAEPSLPLLQETSTTESPVEFRIERSPSTIEGHSNLQPTQNQCWSQRPRVP